MEEDQKQTSFTFEIDNFSEKEGPISSENFLSGGCEWFVIIYPKGDGIDGCLSLYLWAAIPKSLRLGLKRRASFSFVLLNKLGKELYRTKEFCSLLCAQFPGWGCSLRLKNLQEKGVFAKNKLILKVEVKRVIDEKGDVNWNEMLDFNGFQILYSQVGSVCSLFRKHPDIAVNFTLTNQLVRTTYMNVLLGLIDTLNKPPHSLSETELSNARMELVELTKVGFIKLDWLKTMLDEVALNRKKESAGGTRVEKHFTRLNVELNKEKVKATWLENVVHSWNKWKGRVGFAID